MKQKCTGAIQKAQIRLMNGNIVKGDNNGIAHGKCKQSKEGRCDKKNAKKDVKKEGGRLRARVCSQQHFIFHNHSFYYITIMALHPELHQELLRVRAEIRKFNAEEWIDKKTDMLNEYMTKSGLKACVVNLSGGVDSGTLHLSFDATYICFTAATLGLMIAASKKVRCFGPLLVVNCVCPA